METEFIGTLAILVGSFAIGFIVARLRFIHLCRNWSEGWCIGDEAKLDTIMSGDLEIMAWHGRNLFINGFSQDRRACFCVPKDLETDEEGRYQLKIQTILVPLKHLHRVKGNSNP